LLDGAQCLTGLVLNLVQVKQKERLLALLKQHNPHQLLR